MKKKKKTRIKCLNLIIKNQNDYKLQKKKKKKIWIKLNSKKSYLFNCKKKIVIIIIIIIIIVFFPVVFFFLLTISVVNISIGKLFQQFSGLFVFVEVKKSEMRKEETKIEKQTFLT